MWTKAFWQAMFERMLRGAAVSIAAVYFAGDLVFNSLNLHDWEQVLQLGVGGAVGSLVLGVAGNAITKSGPSFSNNEIVNPPEPGVVVQPPPAA